MLMGQDNKYLYCTAHLNARLVSCNSNIELQLIMAGQQARYSPISRQIVFASSTRSIQTTQRYIDGDSDAQRKLVSMI
jgi:hypothetical protein